MILSSRLPKKTLAADERGFTQMNFLDFGLIRENPRLNRS